ncbi:N-6 DNA methylase [Nocardia sp. alder85J]|uniref:N-6 DNA methylase n=1 Tax=Nocardia sp. alder85J TaxID=2862949 RepID=UPI001CD340F3|nr:N-6 DNA methylase [Nocardia sp. alder85J]MCX4092094.1 N-6 DNA methylase [Nocardia sp. alder85J]
MTEPGPRVSAAEISRMAGVTRATVSNWRRRHSGFPKPVGGSESRPEFDLNAVQDWLSGHGSNATESPPTELRMLLRTRQPADVEQLMAKLRYTDEHWSLRGRHADTALVPVMDRVTAVEGPVAVLDALAERALEDTPTTGLYPTPTVVAELMAALVPSADTVFDPACGGGALLLAAARTGATELYGQDVLTAQAQRSRLRIQLETGLTPTVHTGDSLSADAFPDLKAVAVLCNPPYGQRDWGSSRLSFDDRWDFGVPPRGESELAWIQHAVTHLAPGGTAVMLLPPAVADRGSGRRIRLELLRKGALRAVVGLPPGVAQPWHIGLQLWLLRNPATDPPTSDTVLFIDTTGLPGTDWPSASEAVIGAWRAFDVTSPDDAVIPGVAAVARVMDVLGDEVDLTPARYVRSALDPETVAIAVSDWMARLADQLNQLQSTVAALGDWSTGAAPQRRDGTIADFANADALQWFRATPPGSEHSRDPRRILTAADIATGGPPSGSFTTTPPGDIVVIETGDVLIPAVRSGRTDVRGAHVAGPKEAGAICGPQIHLLRTNPDRLDAWFLAGFVTGADNVTATRTATIRFDPGRIRIPLVPLEQQRRHGTVFRQLRELRTAAALTDMYAAKVAQAVTSGLTAGVLMTPTEPP